MVSGRGAEGLKINIGSVSGLPRCQSPALK